MYEKINRLADDLKDKLVAYRRDFHKYAESGWFEMRTTSLVARRLADLGYEVLTGRDVCLAESRMGLPAEQELENSYVRAKEQGADPEFLEATKGGFTGALGILRCGEGPVVALRFDIDALGVVEDESDEHRPWREGFSSVNRGMMHACGHDGHTTIGLGVAEVLMALKDRLRGTVKLIFQPAEEGVRGAKSIVDKGHLDGVDYVLACHINEILADGDRVPDIMAGSGGSFATTKLDAFFYGKSAHAAGSPQDGKNALAAVVTAAQNLLAIPRHSKSDTRVNVGTLNAGSGRNVIPEFAKMELEIRGKTSEGNTYMEDWARRIIKTAAEMHDCTSEIKMMGAAFQLESDQAFMELIRDVCEQDLKTVTVHSELRRESGGSEDFSYMMKRVQDQGGQASMLRILTETAAVGHNKRYDFDDEDALPKAVKALSAVVCKLMS
ncbi:MAG: amidohydrolase [Aminivibrio sp.]|jgi:aminobenzoyl-glutamate utilization protein A